jgi:hypothetical protein
MGQIAQGGQTAVFKSYPHTQKLFQLENYSIGVTTWGQGAIGGRSIAGLIADFSASLGSRPGTIEEAANRLNQFFLPLYNAEFSAVPAAQRPALGFFVGGYPTGAAFSELWEVNYSPQVPPESRMRQVMPQNFFGVGWNGVSHPFFRLQRGIDPRLEAQLLRSGVTQQTIDSAKQAVQGLEMSVFYDSMPVQAAVDFCKYVLDVTIGYNRFEIGTPLTGEPVQLAVITQRSPFRWVAELPFHT